MSGSLFEKLSLTRNIYELSEDESIKNHLLRMLTTRQGAVQTLPDYGLPDINDLTMSRSELTSFICSSIEQGINTYEPRLTKAEVQCLPFSDDTPLRFNFGIKASKVHADGRISPWSWQFTLDGDVITGQ